MVIRINFDNRTLGKNYSKEYSKILTQKREENDEYTTVLYGTNDKKFKMTFKRKKNTLHKSEQN